MVDWYSLITFETVSGFLLESDVNDTLSEKVYTVGGDFESQGVTSIHTSSSRVKSYLNREILVDKFDILLSRQDWKKVDRTPDKEYSYRLAPHLIPNWPITKIDGDVIRHGDRSIFAKGADIPQLKFWAGYRRKDQNLESYPKEVSDNLNKSEVPVLPDIIKDVTARIAIHRANRQLKGLIGVNRTKQMFGDFSGESEKVSADDSYEMKQLKRIQEYRYLT